MVDHCCPASSILILLYRRPRSSLDAWLSMGRQIRLWDEIIFRVSEEYKATCEIVQRFSETSPSAGFGKPSQAIAGPERQGS